MMHWLGRIIDSNDKIRAIVQNSLPSVAMITLNALLPFILEGEVDRKDPQPLIDFTYPRFDIHSRFQSSQFTAVFKSPGKNPKKKVDFGKGPQESMAGSAC